MFTSIQNNSYQKNVIGDYQFTSIQNNCTTKCNSGLPIKLVLQNNFVSNT